MWRRTLACGVLPALWFAAGPGSAVAQNPGSPPVVPRVATGVTAFIGVVPDDVKALEGRLAPANRPVLVTSPVEFIRKFGDFTPPSPQWSAADAIAHRQLMIAVQGFFGNGGIRAWVLRVATIDQLIDLRDELRALRKIDVDLVVVPGATSRAQHEAILQHVALAGDRFALLDARQDPQRYDYATLRSTPLSSDRATLLAPWIVVQDPATGGDVSQPPSGHVAGVIARNDRRRGVHRAPANLEVAGTLAPEHGLSTAEIEALTMHGVLVMRSGSSGRGTRTWGARTLGGRVDPQFRYISVRRTVDFVRESLLEGLEGLPSDDCSTAPGPTETFLHDLWSSGMLQGTKASDAFFVRCDRAGDPLKIGLALQRPTEFIVLTIELN